MIKRMIIALMLPALMLCGCAHESAAVSLPLPETARLRVHVADGRDDAPIEGAAVVIPETGDCVYTDADGSTEIIYLPVNTDAVYEGIYKKPWGEVSLLVYKQGYADYALFHLMIEPNALRDGPVVLLFPKEAGKLPYSLTEGPAQEWVDGLLDKFRP